MGMTNWKNAPKGMIKKPNVSIVKIYLNTRKHDNLDRIVSIYLDYAESQTIKK